jgi:hypothetical protein
MLALFVIIAGAAVRQSIAEQKDTSKRVWKIRSYVFLLMNIRRYPWTTL